jgi:hypothetical protein
MAHQTEPIVCPNPACRAEMSAYGDVGVYTRIGGMKVVCCGTCRTVLGVLPPDSKS